MAHKTMMANYLLTVYLEIIVKMELILVKEKTPKNISNNNNNIKALKASGSNRKKMTLIFCLVDF